MPLLTVTNLQSHEVSLQDPTGLYGVSITVPASGSVTALHVSDDALAALEPQLKAAQTAGLITWVAVTDPAFQSDAALQHLTTVLVTPYNAVANDSYVATNLTTPGAVSVVLSASAPIGQQVKVADLKGDAASNNITITVASSGTINGGASVVINVNKGWALLAKTGATAWAAVLSTQISTSAAGGDLTGSYPNPTIAAGAVTTAKLAAGAVTTAKLAANAVTEPTLSATVRSAPATLSGAGTIDVTKATTLFTSTGAGNALVLPDGSAAGQRLTVIHTVKGASGTGVITPTHAGNFATCTLSAKWDWATFEWSGTAWDVIAAAGVFAGLA